MATAPHLTLHEQHTRAHLLPPLNLILEYPQQILQSISVTMSASGELTKADKLYGE